MSTACSTSRLYCASLAGTCFSINLGGRESLAEPWAAGKDLRLLWLLCVLLAGLGLLHKCPAGGGGGGGSPCWHPSGERGPSQHQIRGRRGWRSQDEEGHPWSTCGSAATVGLGAPGQCWDPHAGLEVGNAAQHGHSLTPSLPATGNWWEDTSSTSGKPLKSPAWPGHVLWASEIPGAPHPLEHLGQGHWPLWVPVASTVLPAQLAAQRVIPGAPPGSGGARQRIPPGTH